MSVRITELTSRQRWHAALGSQPVDRLPFWPKLDRASPRARAEPFQPAGVMPPGCPPEVIRDVCPGLREYPVRN